MATFERPVFTPPAHRGDVVECDDCGRDVLRHRTVGVGLDGEFITVDFDASATLAGRWVMDEEGLMHRPGVRPRRGYELHDCWINRAYVEALKGDHRSD